MRTYVINIFCYMGCIKHVAWHTDTLIFCRAITDVCPTVVSRVMTPWDSYTLIPVSYEHVRLHGKGQWNGSWNPSWPWKTETIQDYLSAPHVIPRVLKGGRGRQEGENQRQPCEDLAQCCWRQGPQAKECSQSPETGKGQETDFFCQSFQKGKQPCQDLNLVLDGKPILDFWPLEL